MLHYRNMTTLASALPSMLSTLASWRLNAADRASINNLPQGVFMRISRRNVLAAAAASGAAILCAPTLLNEEAKPVASVPTSLKGLDLANVQAHFDQQYNGTIRQLAKLQNQLSAFSADCPLH